MKRKLLILMSALAITVSANAYATEPFSFGLRVGGVNHNAFGFSKTDLIDKESKFLNIGGSALAFGEYAFTDMIGAGLEAGYFYGATGKFAGKTTTDKSSIGISAHGVKVNPVVNFYPMGRDDENGILKINVIGDFFIPLNVGVKTHVDEADKQGTVVDVNKNRDVNTLIMGAGLGFGYEFPFGLEVNLRGSYAFNTLLKTDSDVRNNTLKLAKEVKDHAVNVQLSAGFNFASLLEA